MKRDGVGMIIGVRLFSLFICVVLVFSVMKIATSFDKYKKNGYSDWQSYYEKFNADLKNAGIDKIVDEMNHQIAEYAAKKN